MTQEFLQDAIVEDLEQLFSHYTPDGSNPHISLPVSRSTELGKDSHS